MTLTANSSANNYAVSNVLDWQAAKKWRSSTNNAEWILLDAGANNTVAATCVSVVKHNFNSTGSFLLQGNNTNAWGSPSLNETLTYANNTMYKAFNNAAYRYWRLYMDDDNNVNGYEAVGYLYLGNYYQFTESPTKDFPKAYDDTASSWSSKTGQEFVNEGAVNRRYSFQWPWFINTDHLAVEAIYRETGISRPMVVVPDENNTTAMEPVFMRLVEPPAWNHLIAYNWNLTLSFKEQL